MEFLSNLQTRHEQIMHRQCDMGKRMQFGASILYEFFNSLILCKKKQPLKFKKHEKKPI